MTNAGLGKVLGTINGGSATVHARGLMLADRSEVPFAFPAIARPAIVEATFAQALQPAIAELLRDRLALSPVGQPAVQVPLTITDGTCTSAPLQDRQLYDVAVRTDDKGWQVVAPHAVYRRQSWTDFGIAHITDMHVARRIDSFYGHLTEAGRHDAANKLYNWNDRFRGFIRYANYLHGSGRLDVIVATGDNYDYQYELNDDRLAGGNAEFLREMILGRESGRFPNAEELRVPIFMVPGNHDYRKEPYKLNFEVELSDDLKKKIALAGAAVFGAPSIHGALTGLLAGWLVGRQTFAVESSDSYHLETADAIFLTNKLDGVPGTDAQLVKPDRAALMVDIDRENRPYRDYLGEIGSYIVKLGPHRIAMIDSGHDEGVVTDEIAVLIAKAHLGTEDQDAFVGASPNCEGVTDKAFGEICAALDDRDASGLFITALHAPLFNPPNNGYCYYLRETQRAVQSDQVYGFLSNHGGTRAELIDEAERDHETWFHPAGHVRDHRPGAQPFGPRYVKRVAEDDVLFRSGVSRGKAEQLVRYMAGLDGAKRKADLVLAGHTHFNNEFRVGIDQQSNDLAYYFDFYTQNPTRYYPTKFMRGWIGFDAENVTSFADPVEIDRATTLVEITPGAEPDARPWELSSQYMVQVPPYPTPLNEATDRVAWWSEHRPLVIQTGALGPCKIGGEFFSGFRVVTVKDSVIQTIHHVPITRLEEHGYALDWEAAIQAEPPRAYHHVERSRAVAAPQAVGAPSGIAALGASNVVYRDGDGRLHEAWRKGGDAGTTDLTTAGSNAMLAGGDPTSFFDRVDGNQVALYRGKDSHVYSLYWSSGAPKRDSLSADVGAPKATGSPVGYVASDGTRNVFYRAEDGHLHNLWWTGVNPVSHGPVDAPTLAGDPVAYQKPSGEHDVFYRGVDKHIHRLFWPPGNVNHEDLSSVAEAADAVGDPSAFYASDDDSHHVFYRSADGHINVLSWAGAERVGRGDLMMFAQDPITGHKTAAPAADDASGDPVAYYTAANKGRHVVYRAKDGHIWLIYWTGNGVPTCMDLTAEAAAPIAASKPTAFVDVPRTHVMYRGKDDQIHEIWWSSPGLLHQPRRPVSDAEPVVVAQPVQPVDPQVLRDLRRHPPRR